MAFRFVLPLADVGNGISPSSGAILSFFDQGTNTPKETWSDFALTITNGTTVTADSNGLFGDIFIDVACDVSLNDKNGVLIWGPVTVYQSTDELTSDGVATALNSFKTTPEENTASVTPTDKSYPPGHVRRYGAVGDDLADNATPFNRAFLTGHKVTGSREDIYRIISDVALPDSACFDGNGCTIKLSGTSSFLRNSPNADTTTTISSGATQGSVDVVVASATGLAVGEFVRISTSGFPTFWAKIKNIVTTTVTLDHPMPFTYTGTVTLDRYAAGTLGTDMLWHNIIFDGSLTTGPSAANGNIGRFGGYESVSLTNIHATNYAITTSATLIQTLDCLDVNITNCRLYDNEMMSSSNFVDVQEARSAIVSHNFIEGSGFGINVTRCVQGVTVGNIMSGRRTWERTEAVAYSVRGIKMTQVGTALITSNTIDDYDSPVRADGGFRSVIVGNSIRNAGWQTSNTSEIALNVTASDQSEMFGATITGNVVENSGGTAIGVDNGATNGDGRTVISSNYIRNCNAFAVYANDRDCLITDNIIDEWAIPSAADGIYYSSGATISNNRFHNSDNTRNCMRTFLDSGFDYVFDNNVAVDGNPLFASSGVVENSGSGTITSGTTSVTVTHNILGTPGADEIQLTATENPTNTPGLLWVDTITPTQMNINCENDPGASNLDISWRVKKAMPFTAP